ncbi:hypothetical protein [uncultured Desulfovibrio sp.]|uniref:hypothetical protein n=1 Tax=uncultured Desulfovibrio sp. TaxID=167968 RepID=UPI002639BB79|nr:hypothetical protein [uncultured Desulfovibrio sp.]
MTFKPIFSLAAAGGLACTLLLSPVVFLPSPCQAVESSSSTNALSRQYVKEARAFRAQGRYELARQSYVQALSVCHDLREYETIKQELNGIEMLLRTMR